MKSELKIIKYLPKLRKYWKNYVKNYTFDENSEPVKITISCKNPNIEIIFTELGIKIQDDNEYNTYITIDFNDDDNFFDSSFFRKDHTMELVKGNGWCFRIAEESGDYFLYENKKFFDKNNDEVDDIESQCFQYSTLYENSMQYDEIIHYCDIFDTLQAAMEENGVEYLWLDGNYDIFDELMKLLRGWSK